MGQSEQFDISILAQTWNPSVADETRTDFRVAAFGWGRHFEVENANAPTLFAIIRAAVARSDHDALVRSFFAA